MPWKEKPGSTVVGQKQQRGQHHGVLFGQYRRAVERQHRGRTGQDAAGRGRYRKMVKDANTSSTLSASERPAR